MANEPAITKVKAALYDWLLGNLGTDISVFVDHPFDKPFRDDDYDLVNIRCPSVAFETLTYNTWLHTAQFKFDIICVSGIGVSIEAKQQEIAASIVSRIGARVSTAGTFGEMVQDCIPQSCGPDSDESRLSDEGETTFEWSITFLTPLNDFRAIAGANGTVP